MAVRCHRHLQSNDARGRELQGIGQEVQRHLPQSACIPHQSGGQIGGNHRLQLQTLGLALGFHHGDSALGQGTRIKRLRVQINRIGFQLGIVENVVDHAEQHLTGRRDPVRISALGLRQVRAVLQQAREADHTGQRRPQLMAHIGQELRLGPGSGLRDIARRDQLVFQRLGL